jgi:hypothetical protein
MTRSVIGAGFVLAVTFTPLGAQPPRGGGPAWDELERRAAMVRPAANEVRWQRLPWIVDPDEAIAAARTEHRPIFFWAAGGRGRDGLPLERC